MGRTHRSIPPSDRHRTGGSLFNPIIRHPAGRLTVAGILLVLLVTLVSNASAVSTNESRAGALRWDDRTFTSGRALVSHLSVKGIDADAFLRAHPAAAGELGLTAVNWDGKDFFTMAGLGSWSRRTGASLNPLAAATPARGNDPSAQHCTRTARARGKALHALEVLCAQVDGAAGGERLGDRRAGGHRLDRILGRHEAAVCTPTVGSGARRPVAPTSAAPLHRRTRCRARTQAPSSEPSFASATARVRKRRRRTC